MKENLVFNNNTRIVYGFYILSIVFLSFIFNLDYFLCALIFSLIIYDLYVSKIFLNSYFILSFILSFIITNYLILPLVNYNIILFIFFSFFLLSLIQSKYLKIYFLIVVLIFFILFLNLFQLDRNIVYILIFCSFINDTSAYFFGKYFKGPKIIPIISPNKTWSGTISSFLITAILLYYFLNFDFVHSSIISSLFFFGDIYLSSIKRKLNIKDFSHALKDHGGILDRLDSIFLTIFYIYFIVL